MPPASALPRHRFIVDLRGAMRLRQRLQGRWHRRRAGGGRARRGPPPLSLQCRGRLGIPAEVVYVTQTGALWNSPIGFAEFVVAPRSAAWGLRWPAEYRFAGFEEQVGAGGADHSVLYRFEARDWTRQRDFVVTLYDWPTQRIDELVIDQHAQADEGRRLPCPDLSELRPDSPHLAGLDESTLALCRNLPYARHGFPFRRADLREALYRDFAIVRTSADTSPANPPRRDWLRIGAPNAFCSDALLDEQDRAYLAAITAAQARHQGAKTGPR